MIKSYPIDIPYFIRNHVQIAETRSRIKKKRDMLNGNQRHL